MYMCVEDGGRVSVSAAFVTGRTNPEDQSQVITEDTFRIKTCKLCLNE